VLKGARHLTIGGDRVYVAADAGIVILDLAEPLSPGSPPSCRFRARERPRSVPVSFSSPTGRVRRDRRHEKLRAALVPASRHRPRDARRIYVARTYAYVAAAAKASRSSTWRSPRRRS